MPAGTLLRELEPVNVMACLSLCQLCAFLSWLAHNGAGWPGTTA